MNAPLAALLEAGFHEGNPLQAALLVRGGLAALAGYKAVVIAAGGVATLLGLRLWPRDFLAPMGTGLVLVAVVNNVLWLVW